MALPKYLYGNPETILINKWEKSCCKGCAFGEEMGSIRNAELSFA